MLTDTLIKEAREFGKPKQVSMRIITKRTRQLWARQWRTALLTTQVT